MVTLTGRMRVRLLQKLEGVTQWPWWKHVPELTRERLQLLGYPVDDEDPDPVPDDPDDPNDPGAA